MYFQNQFSIFHEVLSYKVFFSRAPMQKQIATCNVQRVQQNSDNPAFDCSDILMVQSLALLSSDYEQDTRQQGQSWASKGCPQRELDCMPSHMGVHSTRGQHRGQVCSWGQECLSIPCSLYLLLPKMYYITMSNVCKIKRQYVWILFGIIWNNIQ